MAPPMRVFKILQKLFRKKAKETGKSNPLLPFKCKCMVNTLSVVKKNPYICKFYLENGDLKKLLKKYFELATTSPYSLQMLLSGDFWC